MKITNEIIRIEERQFPFCCIVFVEGHGKNVSILGEQTDLFFKFLILNLCQIFVLSIFAHLFTA